MSILFSNKYMKGDFKLEWLALCLLEIGIEKNINNFFAFIYKLKLKNKISKEVERITNEFLNRYGNREYYNSLDRFFTNNKVIKKLIGECADLTKNKKNYIELIQYIVIIYLRDNDQYETYKNEIEICLKSIFEEAFQSINELSDIEHVKLTNIISKKMDESTYNIKCELQDATKLIINEYRKNSKNNIDDYQLMSIDQYKFEVHCLDRPFPLSRIAMRKDLVDLLINKLKQENWIHLYGGIWSGKTQLLYLISERVMDYKWIDLDSLDGNNIITNIKYIMQSLCRKVGYSTQEIIDNFIGIIPKKSLILIDGIQLKHINLKGFSALLGSLYQSCIDNDIKIVSSGYCDIKFQMQDYIGNENISSLNIPALNTTEVEELFNVYGAPEDCKREHLSKILGLLDGALPGLVVEIIKEIKEADWILSNEFWDRLFSSDLGDLETILEYLLVTDLNEKERNMLYRVSYVGHNIPISIFSRLAKISPQIDDSQRIRLHLSNRWIQNDREIIIVDKLYKSIAEKNLSTVEKEKIHEIIVDHYKHLKHIDQLDFINLVSHLSYLGKHDDIGYIYMQALSSMIEDNILDDYFGISKFWNDLPLPYNMSSEVKVLVRMQQVRYLSLVQQDYIFALKDIIEIVNETNIGGEFILILMALSKMDFKLCNMCMDAALNNNLWGDAQNKLMELMSESITWKYKDMNIFDLAIMVYALSINTLEEMSIFVSHLIRCNKNDILRVIENYQNIFLCVWERVRKNTNDYIDYENILNSVLEWTDSRLQIIAAQIYVIKMRISFEKSNDYYNALQIYKEVIGNFDTGECRHILVDALSKINVDNKSVDKDLSLIEEAYITILEEDKEVFDNIYTCLNYMEYIPNVDKKLHAAKRMLDLSKNADEDAGDMAICYKVEGEYFINAYLCGDFINCFNDFYMFIMKLINNDFKLRKNFLVYMSHIIGYLVPDIISNKPPTKLENDEIYAPPARKMFINMNESDELADLFNDLKVNQMLLLIAELAFYYNKKEIANTIIIKLVDEEKIYSENSSWILCINGFLTFILLENGFYKQFIDLIYLFFLKQGENEQFTLRFIVYITLFTADISKKNGQAYVDDDLIDTLNLYEGDDITKMYFKELSLILKTFRDENGDIDILTWCGNKLKGTNKNNICGAINILMLSLLAKNRNQKVVQAVDKFLNNCSMSDDIFVKNIMNQFY